MLLCSDLTVNWFILFSSAELFLISQTKILRKSLELKVKYSQKNLAPGTYLRFKADTVLFQSRCKGDLGEVVCQEFSQYGLSGI